MFIQEISFHVKQLMCKIYSLVRSKVKAHLYLSVYIFFYLVDWGKLFTKTGNEIKSHS